jgi:hypothetical protein
VKFLVQRQLPDRDGSPDDPAPPVSPPMPKLSWPVVVCLNEGPVRVSIIEQAPYDWHDNTCRCGACRGSIEGDWAERFLP